jgi:hypothetical protein
MPPSKKPPEFKPRKCRYCKLVFVPVIGAKNNRRNAELQRFCCDNHRKAWHRNGGMNMERLMESVEREVRKMVKRIMTADDETLLEAVREIIRDEQVKANRKPQDNFRDLIAPLGEPSILG